MAETDKTNFKTIFHCLKEMDPLNCNRENMF